MNRSDSAIPSFAPRYTTVGALYSGGLACSVSSTVSVWCSCLADGRASGAHAVSASTTAAMRWSVRCANCASATSLPHNENDEEEEKKKERRKKKRNEGKKKGTKKKKEGRKETISQEEYHNIQ